MARAVVSSQYIYNVSTYSSLHVLRTLRLLILSTIYTSLNGYAFSQRIKNILHIQKDGDLWRRNYLLQTEPSTVLSVQTNF